MSCWGLLVSNLAAGFGRGPQLFTGAVNELGLDMRKPKFELAGVGKLAQITSTWDNRPIDGSTLRLVTSKLYFAVLGAEFHTWRSCH